VPMIFSCECAGLLENGVLANGLSERVYRGLLGLAGPCLPLGFGHQQFPFPSRNI